MHDAKALFLGFSWTPSAPAWRSDLPPLQALLHAHLAALHERNSASQQAPNVELPAPLSNGPYPHGADARLRIARILL